MTDLRMKIISIACALALVAGCMPAVAFAQEDSATASPSPKQQANSLCDEAASSTLAASEDAPSPAPTRIPIDKQAFAQAEDEGISLQSADPNATVSPHDAFSDEFMYFSEFESGKNYDLTLSAGDNYHAMGCYQFDNRYGLQDFLIACYNYSPERYSMLAWLKDADFDLRYEQNADGSYKLNDSGNKISRKLYDKDKQTFTDVGKKLNDSWSAAYNANPNEFSRLQDGWFYQEYVQFAINLCNNSSHNFNMDNRRDCVKGLISGICNLFGSGGMQFFVGGTLYGTHYDGAGLSGTMSDREFVTTLCNYIVDHVAELPYVTSQYVPSYQNRYRNELADCLAYLDSKPDPSNPTPTPGGSTTPTPEPNKAFSDLEDGAWYLQAVEYVSSRGIMKGYDNGTFGPNDTLSRGQLITMLWRLQGSPQADMSTTAFADVDYDSYYGDAIRWARATEIVKGYGDSNDFCPDASITREEIAVMLANFAKRMDGKNPTSDGVKLGQFPDANVVDSWAKTALSWTVDKGIISGKIDASNKAWLNPIDNATRAEAATILMRYLQNR